MGEIADGLINGDFDFYTGEYLGRIPRTSNKALSWEKRKYPGKGKKVFPSKESAYNGVKRYVVLKWEGRKDTPSVRSLVYEYCGQSNIDLKAKCLEIQSDWASFAQWINKKFKETN